MFSTLITSKLFRAFGYFNFDNGPQLKKKKKKNLKILAYYTKNTLEIFQFIMCNKYTIYKVEPKITKK